MLQEGVKLSSLCKFACGFWRFACGFWRELPLKAKVIIILWLVIVSLCAVIANDLGWIDMDAPEY